MSETPEDFPEFLTEEPKEPKKSFEQIASDYMEKISNMLDQDKNNPTGLALPTPSFFMPTMTSVQQVKFIVAVEIFRRDRAALFAARSVAAAAGVTGVFAVAFERRDFIEWHRACKTVLLTVF